MTHLFTSKNLHGRLARWFLTIEEFCPEIKHVPGKATVVADSLSRNIAVVVNNPPPLETFSLPELATAQRDHGLWRRVIYASGCRVLPRRLSPALGGLLLPLRNKCRCTFAVSQCVNGARPRMPASTVSTALALRLTFFASSPRGSGSAPDKRGFARFTRVSCEERCPFLPVGYYPFGDCGPLPSFSLALFAALSTWVGVCCLSAVTFL